MILNAPNSRPPIGWPLLPVPDDAGQLAFPSLEESIRQNLRVILSTRAGEQLMQPRYGAGLTDFIGQPDTLSVRSRIHERVIDGIKRWERRIHLDRVDVSTDTRRAGTLQIQIAYRIRLTSELQTLSAALQLQNETA